LPNPKEDGVAWEQTKRSPLYFDRARRDGHKHVALVEGVTDAALAQVHGDTRVIACVAAELSRQQVQTLARNGVCAVTICLDPDSAGDNGILSCIRSLTAAGITPYVAPRLPDGQDPDEFIQARQIDAWREHLDRAVHAYRYQAEGIIQRHQTGGRISSDVAGESAMEAAVAFAAQQPVGNTDQLARYFWPVILDAVKGGDLQAVQARVQTARGGSEDRHYAAGIDPQPASRERGAAEPIQLGPLTIEPGTPRQTPSGKIIVGIGIRRAGVAIDHVKFSDSASGRHEAEKLIACHLSSDAPERTLVADLLAGIVARAAEVCNRQGPREGKRLYDLIQESVPDAFRLAYRADGGHVWSEARGGKIFRNDFVTFTPGWLLDKACLATDAPRDGAGNIQRPQLIRAVKAELEVLWSDLCESLPHQSGAELNQNTAAAHRFRESMVRLWTATRTFEVSRSGEGTSGEGVAARASLISRVKSRAKDYHSGKVCPRGRERWHEVQKAFAAWWRPVVDDKGEITVLLAMRWELVGQIGVELPGVGNQASLTALGEQFGVLDPSPGVSTVLSGGAQRLAVLSRELTQELLGEPVEEEETGHSDAGDGASVSPDSFSKSEKNPCACARN
jgi:hypothetical protein